MIQWNTRTGTKLKVQDCTGSSLVRGKVLVEVYQQSSLWTRKRSIKWSTISVDRKSICLLLISRILNKNNQTPCAVLLWEENKPQCSNNSNTSGVRWYSGRILYGDTNGPQSNQRWSTNGGKVLVTIKATMPLSWKDSILLLVLEGDLAEIPFQNWIYLSFAYLR